MNITIKATGWAPQGCRYTAIDSDRYGDSPSDALGDLLLQLLEAGDRSPGLIAMLNAESDAALLRERNSV